MLHAQSAKKTNRAFEVALTHDIFQREQLSITTFYADENFLIAINMPPAGESSGNAAPQ
ncbi:hypothetical protein [Aquabacterium sp. CECT 9606]|uniref:hypothetical protein n=1 Tax=Aquabacterium sp. CECT 9606 TaxID=2845822 RepID=UPI001E37C104|nr:hypothetical protein [Aquabacterium sp. CECT 9606]